MKTLSNYNQCPGQDLKLVSPEYEAGVGTRWGWVCSYTGCTVNARQKDAKYRYYTLKTEQKGWNTQVA
jgi:hypothetical protein